MVDNLEIANIGIVLNSTASGEATTLIAEFKLALNGYLKQLVASPVQTLADVIAFNQKFSDIVSILAVYNFFIQALFKIIILLI